MHQPTNKELLAKFQECRNRRREANNRFIELLGSDQSNETNRCSQVIKDTDADIIRVRKAILQNFQDEYGLDFHTVCHILHD